MKIESQGPDKPKDNMKNFLLISLDDKKAKHIAEAINNDSARKILDHLAKKEATETELSKELGIPMSTVHYNLKQLVEANLVVVEEFHYSEKGKEINHYSLANKFIIIAPKNDNSRFLEALKKIMPVTIISAVVGGAMYVIQAIGQGSQASMSASDAAPGLMMAKSVDVANTYAPVATEISRPIWQSNIAATFLVGALIVIIVYFLYEFAKKRN